MKTPILSTIIFVLAAFIFGFVLGYQIHDNQLTNSEILRIESMYQNEAHKTCVEKGGVPIHGIVRDLVDCKF